MQKIIQYIVLSILAFGISSNIFGFLKSENARIMWDDTAISIQNVKTSLSILYHLKGSGDLELMLHPGKEDVTNKLIISQKQEFSTDFEKRYPICNEDIKVKLGRRHVINVEPAIYDVFDIRFGGILNKEISEIPHITDALYQLKFGEKATFISDLSNKTKRDIFDLSILPSKEDAKERTSQIPDTLLIKKNIKGDLIECNSVVTFKYSIKDANYNTIQESDKITLNISNGSLPWPIRNLLPRMRDKEVLRAFVTSKFFNNYKNDKIFNNLTKKREILIIDIEIFNVRK